MNNMVKEEKSKWPSVKNARISEKEFEVIKSLEGLGNYNQRAIARYADISLGLTNLIIKRLIKKGYLKVRQLTPMKIQYILTPKGMVEKARKSYSFTRRTINTLREMKQRIQETVLKEYNKGARKFAIQGKSELANLAEIAIRDMGLVDITCALDTDLEKADIVIFAEENMTSDHKAVGNDRYINILEILST